MNLSAGWAWLTTGLLPAAWVLLLFNLLSARHREVAGPRGLPLEYAAQRSETLVNELAVGAIEVVVLTLIIQPWRQGSLWPWAIGAFALLLPWTGLAFAIGMHAGLMSEAHTLWRLGILAALAAVIVVSGARSLVRRLKAGQAISATER